MSNVGASRIYSCHEATPRIHRENKDLTVHVAVLVPESNLGLEPDCWPPDGAWAARALRDSAMLWSV